MAIGKTIFELVTDDVLRTLQGIKQAAGYANNIEAVKESKAGQGPAPANVNDRYAILVPGELEPRADSPINKDDYNQIFWVDCYGFEPDELPDPDMTPDAVGYSMAGDVKKALESDESYQRGTHPTTGNFLALNTK